MRRGLKREEKKKQKQKRIFGWTPIFGWSAPLYTFVSFFFCFCLFHVGPVISNLDSTNNNHTYTQEAHLPSQTSKGHPFWLGSAIRSHFRLLYKSLRSSSSDAQCATSLLSQNSSRRQLFSFGCDRVLWILTPLFFLGEVFRVLCPVIPPFFF